MVTDRGIFTIEDDVKSYVLCRIVPLSMTSVTPCPSFKVTVPYTGSLKANISQTVHPIHSMFVLG